MNILVTNDDGIYAEGLWTLVKELKNIGKVTVVAPDREQSAVGTALTLRQVLRIHRVKPEISGIDTFTTEGTPGDSVILALGQIIKDKVDLVVSGINYGPNVGDDVLISGTVGGALQGFLRGIPSIAVSLASIWGQTDSLHLETAALVTTLIAEKLCSNNPMTNAFLNVNVPDVPINEIRGIKPTRFAHETHVETVEEGNDGKKSYYWLMRHAIPCNPEKRTDIYTVQQCSVSITPLHSVFSRKRGIRITENFCDDIFEKIQTTVSLKNR